MEPTSTGLVKRRTFQASVETIFFRERGENNCRSSYTVLILKAVGRCLSCESFHLLLDSGKAEIKRVTRFLNLTIHCPGRTTARCQVIRKSDPLWISDLHGSLNRIEGDCSNLQECPQVRLASMNLRNGSAGYSASFSLAANNGYHMHLARLPAQMLKHTSACLTKRWKATSSVPLLVGKLPWSTIGMNWRHM